MAINNKKGFALLIAVIFMSVVLTLGLALGSLGYKQQVLASGAVESQYAFYAADSAMECALYADQQQNLFAYNANLGAPVPSMTCDGAAPYTASIISHTSSLWVMFNRVSLDKDPNGNPTRCADVTIYKYSSPQPPNNVVTYLFSQGYDVSCATVANPAGARFVSRGMDINY